MRSRVGPAVSNSQTGCSYTEPDLSVACQSPPNFHLLVKSDRHGVVTLVSCRHHLLEALAAADLVGMHSYQPVCDLPRTSWMWSHCEPPSKASNDG